MSVRLTTFYYSNTKINRIETTTHYKVHKQPALCWKLHRWTVLDRSVYERYQYFRLNLNLVIYSIRRWWGSEEGWGSVYSKSLFTFSLPTRDYSVTPRLPDSHPEKSDNRPRSLLPVWVLPWPRQWPCEPNKTTTKFCVLVRFVGVFTPDSCRYETQFARITVVSGEVERDRTSSNGSNTRVGQDQGRPLKPYESFKGKVWTVRVYFSLEKEKEKNFPD